MEWWNDLWLNEGFASFMENVGVNHVHPEWKMMDQFFLDKFQVSSALDQLNNSHPIMAEVKDPAQINSLFDSISYDKVSEKPQSHGIPANSHALGVVSWIEMYISHWLMLTNQILMPD